MSTHKSILKSASVVGLATLCSRILGFIRDIVIARLFGVYMYAQAFVIAFKIPNLLRDMVGEGAANAAFVPVFSEYAQNKSKKEFWELANVVLNLLLIVLMFLTILGVFFAPFMVRLIAPGFADDPLKLAATVKLARIIFPYIVLISLAAYTMALLNSLKHFSVPAFAPCLLNISIIIFAMVFGEGIKGLALGVLVGGVLQLAIQVPILLKKGFQLRLFRRFRHPEANHIGRLLLPRLFSSCIYQLNNFVDSIFGSLTRFVGEGGVAGLYFAYRLVLFPLGIFSTALSQVILPTFSTQALEDKQDTLRHTLSFGLRANFFVIVPASAAFIALSYPIISTLFQGGRFDSYSTAMTARVLFFYSFGLCAYGATKILQSCFFALKDTATPAKISLLALLVNITLNAGFVFIFKFGLAGIALANSISGFNTCIFLFFLLNKRLAPINLKEIFSSFWRIFAASVGMGGVCFVVARIPFFNHSTISIKIIQLCAAVFAGLISYIFFCFVFRVREIQDLWAVVRLRMKS